jgi:hypothetical protein
MNNATTPATSPAKIDSTGNPGTGELGGSPMNPVVIARVVDVVVVVRVWVDVVDVETVDVVTVVVAVTDWVVVEVVVTGTVIVVVTMVTMPAPNRRIKPFWPTDQPS